MLPGANPSKTRIPHATSPSMTVPAQKAPNVRAGVSNDLGIPVSSGQVTNRVSDVESPEVWKASTAEHHLTVLGTSTRGFGFRLKVLP